MTKKNTILPDKTTPTTLPLFIKAMMIKASMPTNVVYNSASTRIIVTLFGAATKYKSLVKAKAKSCPDIIPVTYNVNKKLAVTSFAFDTSEITYYDDFVIAIAFAGLKIKKSNKPNQILVKF